MKSYKITPLLVGAFLIFQCAVAQDNNKKTEKPERPALVVNIVVGGMPYDFITRYGHNLSADGFNKFRDEGVVFTSGRYNYMPTNSASSLATITTGTYPYVNGIVGEQWRDVLTGDYVSLIKDPSANGLNCEYGEESYSNINLVVPSLGDRLKRENPKSKVISIAADPVSAIVLGGLDAEVYWMNPATAAWTTSSKYMLYLPGWVIKFNDQYKGSSYVNDWFWGLYRKQECYVNRRFGKMEIKDAKSSAGFRKMNEIGALAPSMNKGRYSSRLSTPLANELVVDFAQQVIIQEGLGTDENPDILNICFDAPRNVIKHYGPESVEAEDMFYQLDKAIASLMRFVSAQYPDDRVLFVLTADHGSSESYDISVAERSRFNGDQFRAIVNSFLCAQYGGEDWVTGYYNRRLYINRKVAFNLNLSVDDVQRRASDFALQFRGLARVVPSCDLRGGSAADPYMQRMRNGYYPKRSGDLLIDLVPNWIEEVNGVRSSTGSSYDYDTHVPLMMTGCGLQAGVITTEVDMASLPVTLARILGIQRPEAATAGVIVPVFDYMK